MGVVDIDGDGEYGIFFEMEVVANGGKGRFRNGDYYTLYQLWLY